MAKNMIKLKAPEGASSVHFGGEDYEVKKGFVEVPEAAVEALTGAHGYTFPVTEAAGQQAGTGDAKGAAKGSAQAATQNGAQQPAWAAGGQQ